MVPFPSREWIALFQEELNRNAAYEEAARSWEGDFLFLIQPDPSLKEPATFYLDLFHGKCREAEMLPNPQARSAAFSLEGSYGDWRRLISKEIDPVQALMGGKFRFKGNMLKVMRYNRAARELVNTATLIPTEFV